MAQNATGAAWSRSGGATRVGASMADAEQKRRNAEYSAKYHAKKKAEHAELVAAHCPAPGKGLVFVCGPPPMYAAICGPRDADGVTGLLGAAGYARSDVYTF